MDSIMSWISNPYDNDVGKLVSKMNSFNTVWINGASRCKRNYPHFYIFSDKLTDEKNTSEDWGMIMDFCDRVQATKDGPRDCLKSIIRRLNHQDPHVVIQAITVGHIQ